mgnify:CR=1 FL=1|tara:strand:- start:294 stop:548 length:255 start_codon:yes stop_codon:yes gene_type:complete
MRDSTDISDQLAVMTQLMDTVDLHDPEVDELADRVIDACLGMVQMGMKIRLLDMLGELYVSDEENEIINEFEEWAYKAVNTLEN